MVQDYVDGNEHCKYLFNTLSLSKACKRLLRLRLDVTRKDHLVLCLVARRRIGRRRTASSIAQGTHNSFTVARHIIRRVMCSSCKQCDVISGSRLLNAKKNPCHMLFKKRSRTATLCF